MSRKMAEFEFRSLFGCSPQVATDLWYATTFTDPKTQIKHFLWGLMYMKVYASESVLAMMAGSLAIERLSESGHGKILLIWPVVFQTL